MHFLDIPMREFLLHDSSINNVECAKSRLTLDFKHGFYNKDHKQLESCKVVISIESCDPNNVNSFFKVKRCGFINKEILFERFQKMIRHDNLVVESEFYSEFERAVLIFGRIQQDHFELKITDIDKISFIYK